MAVTALALVAAGCGSSSHARPGPAPTAHDLVRRSLIAAAAAPGAKYDLVVDATLNGTLPKELQRYVRTEPHLRVTGTVGRELFTAHISSSIPQIAIVTGDEIVAGPGFAYLRFQDTWYGSGTQGLARFWRRLPGLALGRPAARAELFSLLANAVDGTVAPGPSRDGVDTWELSGRPGARALSALLRPLTALRGVHVAKVAARSQAEYGVGRDDLLPRRLHVELHAVRADFGRALAARAPNLDGVDVVIDLELTSWGEQPPVARPQNPKTYAEYLDRLGLGG
jgi:hypothetical protein